MYLSKGNATQTLISARECWLLLKNGDPTLIDELVDLGFSESASRDHLIRFEVVDHERFPGLPAQQVVLPAHDGPWDGGDPSRRFEMILLRSIKR